MRSESMCSAGRGQEGFSLLEIVIAITVMTVGLFGMAQLFIATTYLNASANNRSQYLTEAERVEESFKVAAVTLTSQTAVDAVVTSSVTEPAVNATIAARKEIYVLDSTGNLVKPAGSTVTLPSELAAVYGPTKTCAPSTRARLAIVRLTPRVIDPRANEVVTLVSTIEMKESYP